MNHELKLHEIQKHLLIYIMHHLHRCTQPALCVQDYRINRDVPLGILVVQSLDMTHPGAASIVAVTNEELSVHQVL